ncbi:hypothetical protein MRB53_016287 [Persea americana]|uniref:Uncharacterized protein n=1 Tax=Persea americana TaxID=3435 RepID=A0ACC2M1Q5_PERAE|nr:hypothetical protein MRB53_016287 [Persea americana]
MFSFARVQVLLDVASSSPRTLIVELEGEDSLEVEVQYESIPCSKCLSPGHLPTKCPYKKKPGLMKTPAQAAVLITPSTLEVCGLETEASFQAPPATIAFASTNSKDSDSAHVKEAHPKELAIQNSQVTLDTLYPFANHPSDPASLGLLKWTAPPLSSASHHPPIFAIILCHSNPN